MTKASKLVLGRGMKIRMRTETGPAEEPEGAVADEMSEADLKAELAKMAGDAEVEEDEDDVSPDSLEDDADDERQRARRRGEDAGREERRRRAGSEPRGGVGTQAVGRHAQGGEGRDRRPVRRDRQALRAGQEAQLEAARKTLENCMTVLSKLDSELDALLVAKDMNDRAQKKARARNTADALIQFVKSNKVMASLDDNEVRKITAAKKLTSSLTEVKAALA